MLSFSVKSLALFKSPTSSIDVQKAYIHRNKNRSDYHRTQVFYRTQLHHFAFLRLHYLDKH